MSAHELLVAAVGLVAFGSVAFAEDSAVPSCTPDQIKPSTPAPMPTDFRSLNLLATEGVHAAGYILTIDAVGTPSVVCAMDRMTASEIREAGAAAVGKLKFLPADQTRNGAVRYIHIQSMPGGTMVSSILPPKAAPLCSEVKPVGSSERLEPIHKGEAEFPEYDGDMYREKGVMVYGRVDETGAVFPMCRPFGSGHDDAFKLSTYFYVAQLRFAARPGRPPFDFGVTINFVQGGNSDGEPR